MATGGGHRDGMISFCETPFSLLSSFRGRILGTVWVAMSSDPFPTHIYKKVPLLGPDSFLGERAFSDGATTVCEALGT